MKIGQWIGSLMAACVLALPSTGLLAEAEGRSASDPVVQAAVSDARGSAP